MFVGGWGSSMYRYANDPSLDGTTDNYTKPADPHTGAASEGEPRKG